MFTSLRWYQEDMTDAVYEIFQSGAARVLAVLPCGGGKTYTAAAGLCRPYRKVLWLAHRRRLLQQANESFQKLGRNDVVFHSVFKRPDPTWGKFDLVVLDEAHHESCSTIRDLQDRLRFDRFLGLTATPKREDNATLYFDAQVVGISIDQLVAEGYLAPPWVYSVRCKGDILEVLPSWMNAHKSMLGPTIVFVPTKAAGAEFSEKLQMRTTIVTGKSNRERQLQDFEDGKVDVLFSCLILTEGTDLPCTKSVVVARNTRSKSMLTQMAGRAMRTYKGKLNCNLVEALPYASRAKVLMRQVVTPNKRYVSSRSRDGWQTRELGRS